ncbi:putative alkaline shock family protein YloU [Microbacterium proteolyticum]|uniref:Putative alkaline shock family protein YloU n=1 Tax=Microbacterium proteolyticum TaxID=1572644 RepID=A0A7W5CGP1_9MICO|nr:Asp23/Gls24 family envelope stress response protein [Microbacterium proteolyticum]MBB3157340.1 putative alkaline shock family protein YloU [Microbacterium proteolyticum]
MTNDSIPIPSPASQPAPADLARAVADVVAHVEGVHALGTLVERASDSVRQRVGLAGGVAGVTVDRGRDGRVTSAVSVIVGYPHKLREVADAVRAAARHALDGLGSDRIDVDVTVAGVWGPFDTDPVAETEQVLDDAGTEADGDDTAPDTDTRDGSRGGERTDAAATHDARDDVSRGDRPASPVAGSQTAPDRNDTQADVADTQDAVADALSEVADSVAHAAEELRDRPDSPRP